MRPVDRRPPTRETSQSLNRLHLDATRPCAICCVRAVAKYRRLMVKDSDGVWKPITQARRYPVVKSTIEYPL